MANKRGLCLNPRGTLWANDQNKFGQKMLEKMGWKLGQGLGAREDGLVDPIRIPYKNDTKGLGCADCPDPWLNNQESFNDLLSQLNGNVQDCPDAPLVSSSLTEKSKSSRKRVHYHKFARSKDLSCRSLEELASVLGDKSLMKIKLKKDVQMDCDTDDVVQTTSEDEEVDERHRRRKDKLRKKKLKRENDEERNVSEDGSINKEEFVGHRKKKKPCEENEDDKHSEGKHARRNINVEDTAKLKKLGLQKCDLEQSVESDVEKEQSESEEVQKQQHSLQNETDHPIMESCKNNAVNWEGIKLFKGSNLLSLRGYGNDVSLNGPI